MGGEDTRWEAAITQVKKIVGWTEVVAMWIEKRLDCRRRRNIGWHPTFGGTWRIMG